MAINLQTLYDVAKIKHQAGVGAGTFDELFINSINRVNADLEALGVDDSEVTTLVSSYTETFSLPHSMYNAFADGVDFFLSSIVSMSVIDPNVAEARYRRSLKDAYQAWLRDEEEIESKFGADLT